VQNIRWEETAAPFLFETLVKPLRLGVEVIEIPSVWKARTEGKSAEYVSSQLRLLSHGLANAFCKPQVNTQVRHTSQESRSRFEDSHCNDNHQPSTEAIHKFQAIEGLRAGSYRR